MNVNLITAICAFALMAIDLISLIFRLKAGKDNVKTERTKAFWSREISIFICAPLLPLLCIFIDLGLIGTIAICACSVLAVEIAIQELVGKKNPEEK
ncbi:MAG: hypothetical protein K5829_14300 [Treponema sp.]|nr:hypothetical protein [Treponema sp.]